MLTGSDQPNPLAEKPFVDAIEEFKDFASRTGRAFLIGAGCSKCAGLPTTAELSAGVIASELLDHTSKSIMNAIQSSYGRDSDANIEDFLSELIGLLAIADRRVARHSSKSDVSLAGNEYTGDQLRAAVDQTKQAIAEAITIQPTIETHRRFVRALHRPLWMGRTPPGQAVDYLVLSPTPYLRTPSEWSGCRLPMALMEARLRGGIQTRSTGRDWRHEF